MRLLTHVWEDGCFLVNDCLNVTCNFLVRLYLIMQVSTFARGDTAVRVPSQIQQTDPSVSGRGYTELPSCQRRRYTSSAYDVRRSCRRSTCSCWPLRGPYWNKIPFRSCSRCLRRCKRTCFKVMDRCSKHPPTRSRSKEPRRIEHR